MYGVLMVLFAGKSPNVLPDMVYIYIYIYMVLANPVNNSCVLCGRVKVLHHRCRAVASALY
jgi:hypothetical protein